MNKLTKSLMLSGLVSLPFASGLALAGDAATLVPKISVYSEYDTAEFRKRLKSRLCNSIWTIRTRAAFTLGRSCPTSKWLKDTAKAGGFSTSAQLEWDLFGGYRFEVVKDVTVDVGYLRYEYPSAGAFIPSPIPTRSTPA